MNDKTLISPETIAVVLAQCANLQEAGNRLFEGEPHFRAAVQTHFLAIAGRLCLSGASARLTREVAQEIDHLVIFAATTIQTAYRQLLDGLSPELIERTEPILPPQNESEMGSPTIIVGKGDHHEADPQ